MVLNAPTPAPDPSPGALSTLLVHSTPRLATPRHASPSGPELACVPVERTRLRPVPSFSPAPFTGPSAIQGRWAPKNRRRAESRYPPSTARTSGCHRKRRPEGGRRAGDGVGGSPQPVVDLLRRPNSALVRVVSATLSQRVSRVSRGLVHSTPTPAPDPSPGVLSTLLVHGPPGLAIQSKIGVLCTIERTRSRRPSPSQRRSPSRPPSMGDGRQKVLRGPESRQPPSRPSTARAALPDPGRPGQDARRHGCESFHHGREPDPPDPQGAPRRR